MAAQTPHLRLLLCGFFFLTCAADLLGKDSGLPDTSHKNSDSSLVNTTEGGHSGDDSRQPQTTPVPGREEGESKASNLTDKQAYLTNPDDSRVKNSEGEASPGAEKAESGEASTEKVDLSGSVGEGESDKSSHVQTIANTARPVSNNAEESDNSREVEEGETPPRNVNSDSGEQSQPDDAGKNNKNSADSSTESPAEPDHVSEDDTSRASGHPSTNKSELRHQQHEGDKDVTSDGVNVSSTSPPGDDESKSSAGDSSLSDVEPHNVVHSALTSDYDGELMDQTSNVKGDISTSATPDTEEDEGDVFSDEEEDEEDIIDDEEDEEEEEESDEYEEIEDGLVVTDGVKPRPPSRKTTPIANKIQHVQGNGEGTYFLADPSEENHVEIGEELHNTVGADDGDQDYDDYDDDYYYDDDDEDWYYDDDDKEDDEYSDIDDGEDKFEGYNDDDYYYDYDDDDDDDDDDSDASDDADKGGTYEPGVMTDAEWIMREGRLGKAHRAKEYHIGQELHDFDTHLGPMSGSENELRHVPFEYEPSYDGNNMSLLVFYTWLGVVAFMVIVALVALKHRQKISNLFWETKTGYRRDRSRLVTEEGHTLLSHQHV